MHDGKMTDKSQILNIVEEYAQQHGLFVVDVLLKKGNRIVVYIDSMQGVHIEQCVDLSRHIESFMNRDEEDFELEVSSPGLDHPLMHPLQYEKNIGKQVSVLTDEGTKLTGKLLAYDGHSLTLEAEKKIREGKKKHTETVQENILMQDIRQTKVIVTFK